jgi:hypothetical protein
VSRAGASARHRAAAALRATLEELLQHRAALERQLESAGLALGDLRLDPIRFRPSGGQPALSDVATATREARALSRDIGGMLEAAAEVRSLEPAGAGGDTCDPAPPPAEAYRMSGRASGRGSVRGFGAIVGSLAS